MIERENPTQQNSKQTKSRKARAAASGSPGIVLSNLKAMPPDETLGVAEMTEVFCIAERTLRAMQARGELPRPFRFAGKNWWFASQVAGHVERRIRRACEEADVEANRLASLVSGIPMKSRATNLSAAGRAAISQAQPGSKSGVPKRPTIGAIQSSPAAG